MRFGVRVSGSDKVRGALAALSERVKDLHPALLRASIVPLTAAQGRINAQGPGWPPPAMDYGKGELLHRDGALFRSFTVGDSANVQEDIPGGIRVGTNLRTPDGRFNIGMLMQYGTGPIKPKRGKFLVFEVNGQKIFSRGTKGIPARPTLYWD